ncbi:hypothetical protein D3C78_1832770 [compost metagenome]
MVSCMACSWFCASDDSVMPTVRLAAMNSSAARYTLNSEPWNGTWKTKRAASRMMLAWISPIAM